VPEAISTINLVEIGPGTGIMMCDILRTLKQFTGNLKNIQVNLIEASPNLRKVQQERLLKYIQENMEIFLSFEVPEEPEEAEKGQPQKEVIQVDRFKNKD
jgi:SAM-dependent MidA family methyltransferase